MNSSAGYEGTNINVLNVAKEEYTHQLNRVLSPLVYQGLESIYEDALQLGNEENIFRQYQELLKEVPKWNSHIIKEECERILQVQDWMHDLVTAVFVTNVKILTSVKITKKEKEFKLKMPTFETFIHGVYIEAARQFFTNPFIMYHKETIKKSNKNKKEAIKLIKECIEETIRIMLPVQHILKEYMNQEDDDYERDTDLSARDMMNTDITSNNNTNESKLRQMAQRDVSRNMGMFGDNSQNNHGNQNSLNNNQNFYNNNDNDNDINNNDNTNNDMLDDNESNVSEIGENDEIEEREDDEIEEDDEIIDDEENDENVRSVQINDKKSQEKIRNNMSNVQSTSNSKPKSSSRLSRYDNGDSDSEESE